MKKRTLLPYQNFVPVREYYKVLVCFFYYINMLTVEKKMFRYKFGINQLKTERETRT